MNDYFWMQQAYELALTAKTQQEVPVGAVIVASDGRLIASAYNQTNTLCDPTAHAELLAVRRAAECRQNHRILDTTLYVTLEPCCMCMGALIQARIHRLVYATRDLVAGAAGSLLNLSHLKRLNHTIIVDEGILQAECAQLLFDFFQKKRARLF